MSARADVPARTRVPSPVVAAEWRNLRENETARARARLSARARLCPLPDIPLLLRYLQQQHARQFADDEAAGHLVAGRDGQHFDGDLWGVGNADDSDVRAPSHALEQAAPAARSLRLVTNASGAAAPAIRPSSSYATPAPRHPWLTHHGSGRPVLDAEHAAGQAAAQLGRAGFLILCGEGAGPRRSQHRVRRLWFGFARVVARSVSGLGGQQAPVGGAARAPQISRVSVERAEPAAWAQRVQVCRRQTAPTRPRAGAASPTAHCRRAGARDEAGASGRRGGAPHAAGRRRRTPPPLLSPHQKKTRTLSALTCAGGGGSQSAILDMGSDSAVHSLDEREGCRPRPGPPAEAIDVGAAGLGGSSAGVTHGE